MLKALIKAVWYGAKLRWFGGTRPNMLDRDPKDGGYKS
jgi:hypothetical protein